MLSAAASSALISLSERVTSADAPLLIEGDHLGEVLLDAVGQVEPVDIHEAAAEVVQIPLKGAAHLSG